MLIAVALLFSRLAEAQDYEPRGLTIAFGPSMMKARSDSTGKATGLGLNGSLGYGFSPAVQLFLNVDVGGVRDTRTRIIAHADLAGRYMFPFRRLMPYAEIAFSARALELDEDVQLLGNGLGFAFGVEIPVKRARSIDIAVVQYNGAGDEVRHEGRSIAHVQPHSRSTRIRVSYRLRAPSLR